MSKTIITLLSIFPGLGLWVMGHRKAAFLSIIFFICTVLGGLKVDSDSISDLALTIAMIIWITQFGSSIYANKVRNELGLGIGETPPQKSRSQADINIPPTTRRFSRGIYKSVQTILEPDETLELVVGSSTSFLALSDKRLLLITRDIDGSPAVIYPYTFSDIKDASIKPGILYDNLSFNFGQKGAATCSFSRGFRQETNEIVNQIRLRNNNTVKL